MSSTLKDYILEGGQLMVALAGIFFVVLSLAVYAVLLYTSEVRRARRFRRRLERSDGSLTRGDLMRAANGEDALPARYLRELDQEIEMLNLDEESAFVRDQQSREVEDRLVEALEWPNELLHFLGTYAAKIGLCGTILGLCMHFLAFGTDGDSEMAARAMAVALYTTLGALTIALVAEPASYVLGWGERWFRADLRHWARIFERARTQPEGEGGDSLDDEGARVGPDHCDRRLTESPAVETPLAGPSVGEQGVA
jgi:biopolymer transport protein ExbB/TolQ